MSGAGGEGYGDLLSLLAEYAQEPSVPVTAEVSVLGGGVSGPDRRLGSGWIAQRPDWG